MSGNASFNSTFEVTPMREPIQKSKGKSQYLHYNSPLIINKFFDSDSMLSAEAPEFIPRACTNVTPHSHHRNQSTVHMVGQNTYRNQNHGLHFSVRNISIYNIFQYVC